MATTNISIKLMIDTEANKVLFAEASKDFVDFLFFLLALPIGTVIKLLTSESMVGSIGNLFTSFANLNETYLAPSINQNDLLNPVVFSSTNTPLLISQSSIISSRNLYTCRCDHRTCVTNIYDGASCSVCGQKFNQSLKFVAGSDEKGTTVITPPNDSMVLQGYVKEMVPYLVSDDLSVKPMSTMSIISMTKTCNASKLEERRVNIGTKEAMELLKMSFQSTTVLSDVFLGRKQDKDGFQQSDPCISDDHQGFQGPTSGDIVSSSFELSLTRSCPPSSGVTMPPKDQTSKKRTRSPSPPCTRSQAVPSRGGGNQAPSSSRQHTQNRAASQPRRSAIPVPFTDLATPTQVHYFKTYILKCGLILECGIDFPAVDPSILTEAARRNWLTLAAHPSKEINVTMVHEFLALIHKVTPEPTSVTVRGVTVDFSSSAIMAHFKIPDFPIEEHFETVWKLRKPWLRDAKVNEAHDFLDKNALWADGQFPYGSISPAAKVWKQFVNVHFHPALYYPQYQDVTEDEALILLAILTKVPVHVGHLIHKSIIKFANQFTDRKIPFPNTISALCNSAGVTRRASDRVAMANSVIIGPDQLVAKSLFATWPTSIEITALGAEIKALRSDVHAGFGRLSEKAEDLRACINGQRCDSGNIARGVGTDPDKFPHTVPVAPAVVNPMASSSGTTGAPCTTPIPMTGLDEHGATVEPVVDGPVTMASHLHDSSVLQAVEILIKDLHA